MEYLEGGELFDRISEESFTLTETACVDFLTQICQGVRYLHSQDVLHLDLKVSNRRDCVWSHHFKYILQPENIVCSEKDGTNIKIVDFGSAKTFSSEKVRYSIAVLSVKFCCL